MASITTFFGTQGGGGISGSGAAGQVAFFDSASSVSGSNDLYWSSLDGVLAINSFDPTLAGSKLEIQGDNSPATALFTARTGQIWGGNTIMALRERGCLELTSYSSTGSDLSSVFIGHSSIGTSAASAIRNVAIGNLDAFSKAPGQDLTTGDDNVLLGAGAGADIQDGSFNVAIGGRALGVCVSSSSNVAVGNQSLSVCTGASNTAVGSGAGREITSTDQNTFIGDSAGRYRGASPSTNNNTNCIQSVYLGASSRSIAAGGATNEIVIGYNATGNGSNSVTLGDTTITDTYLRGDIHLENSPSIYFSTVTGTSIGSAPTEKLSFYGVAPIVQPDNLITSATAVHGSGQAVKDDSTFGGYTIGQIVTALQTLGLLA